MFSLKSFRAALAALTATKAERPEALGVFIAEAAEAAASADLLAGSGELISDFLDALKASGKSPTAARLRRAARSADHGALAPWCAVSTPQNGEWRATRCPGFTQGNSKSCTDRKVREAAITEWTAALKAAVVKEFTPAVLKTAGVKNPFSFLEVSAEALTSKLEGASVEEIAQAIASAEAILRCLRDAQAAEEAAAAAAPVVKVRRKAVKKTA